MTPRAVADFVALELPDDVSHVVDFAAGDGALLEAGTHRSDSGAGLNARVERGRSPRPLGRGGCQFPRWLSSVTKGVCATVLTKHDLMMMPLFSRR